MINSSYKEMNENSRIFKWADGQSEWRDRGDKNDFPSEISGAPRPESVPVLVDGWPRSPANGSAGVFWPLGSQVMEEQQAETHHHPSSQRNRPRVCLCVQDLMEGAGWSTAHCDTAHRSVCLSCFLLHSTGRNLWKMSDRFYLPTEIKQVPTK